MADGQVVSDPSLRFLAACAHALAASDDLDDILEALLHGAIDRTDAAAGAVFVLDEDRRRLMLAVGVGLAPPADPPADSGDYAISLDGDDPMATSIERDSVVIVDAENDAPRGRLLELGGLRAGIFAALSVVRDGLERPVGAIGLCWPDRVPEGDSLSVASAVADLAAVAVDRARAVSSTAEREDWHERLAHTDPLTGVANRRTFDRMLELELARAARQGGEVTVAIFDVDEFETTVRAGGRSAGDAVLRTVASVLAESVRLVDTVGRYGPDEFVVVAPGSAGPVVARRVLEGIGSLGEVAGRQISVSAGVATFPADGASADELLASAEAALGTARASGIGAIGTAGAGGSD